MSRKGQVAAASAGITRFEPRLQIFDELPTSLYMKAKDLPANSEVAAHQHNWDQLVYAVSGVLEVRTDAGHYMIPPQQAVWIPANHRHLIATRGGAELRSVHLQAGRVRLAKVAIEVLQADALSRALISRASTFDYEQPLGDKQQRLLLVLMDHIDELPVVDLCLPLSDDPLLVPVLRWLLQHPADDKSLSQWASDLGASSKTLGRRFERCLGLSFRRWREQLRLHQAIEALALGHSVTRVALDLGYDSLPAFIQMFKRLTGVTPGKFHQQGGSVSGTSQTGL